MPFFCIHCKSEIDPKFKACPFCGEAITDFLRRYLETPLDGKYQILSRLGVGGMGEVYKVLHTHLNAIRVIKLMRSNIASDPGAHERFLREARLATKIHHTNVASLFDFSTLDDGSHYMVWEYIEGTNLHELIDQRGPLSPRYAAKLAAQALMGLDAVHRSGIVHRDVSPENLMITRDDDGEELVKIIDLGIAKSSSADDNNTKTGMFVGKWKYCSPEHLGMLQSGERIDGRADIYSFGIVLYEMLTGVPPFQADTPHQYLMMHSQQKPKKLRDSNPHMVAAGGLEALIFKALEKDRNNRFATAREFAQELERIGPTLSDAGGAPTPLPPTAEVTNEATRMTPREAETAISLAEDAPTVVTRELDRPAVASGAAFGGAAAASRAELAGRGGRRFTGVIAALVLAIAVATGAFTMFREKPAVAANPTTQPAVQVATALTPLPTALPAAIQQQPGRLGINAFPWATVTSIRNLDSGEQVTAGQDLVTPAPVDLAPGRYEVTLKNPKFAKPMTREVTIAPGGDATLTVHFTDPYSVSLPDFGGSR